MTHVAPRAVGTSLASTTSGDLAPPGQDTPHDGRRRRPGLASDGGLVGKRGRSWGAVALDKRPPWFSPPRVRGTPKSVTPRGELRLQPFTRVSVLASVRVMTTTTTTTATHPTELPRDVRRQRTAELFRLAADAEGEEREQLIDEVIVTNTSVARTIAKRYANRGVPLDDLEQVACLALVRAARRFDGDRAEDFLVYAVPTIRGELKRWFRDHGWTVRPPRRLQELQADVLRAREEVAETADGEADSAEIAAHLGLDRAEVDEALSVRGCFAPTSLDAPVDAEGGGVPLGELLSSGEEAVERAEDRVILHHALRRLTPRERLIVKLRFADDLTQGEIGERIGVTQMQVSRLLSKVMATLRAELAETPLAA